MKTTHQNPALRNFSQPVSTKIPVQNQQQLIVCSLAAVPAVVSATAAKGLVSVLDPELIPETPNTIAPDRHFKLAIDDIEAPHPGLKHAELRHVDALCQFARNWSASFERHGQNALPRDKAGSIVIHCYAGVSRSSAAAYVMLCALNPEVSELTIANYMRSRSKTASPNRLIVSLGDQVLGRNGRMNKAIRSISGHGSFEAARPYALHARLEDVPTRPFWATNAA